MFPTTLKIKIINKLTATMIFATVNVVRLSYLDSTST